MDGRRVLRSAIARDAVVAAFFVAVACAWWWPLPLHLRSGQIESPLIDAAFNQWILAWGTHALTTDPLSFFDANMFHPFDDALAWGDHLFGLAIFALPVMPVLGVVGTFNALLVGSSAASGYTAFKLGEELTGRRDTALVGGLLWAFCAARVLELTHIQILATQWIPLVFLFAERWCGPNGRRRHVVALGISTWLVLVTNVYLAIYTTIAFAVWAAARAATRQMRWRALLGLAVAWTVAVVAALPLYLPGISVQEELGVRRGLDIQSSARLDAMLPLPFPGQPAQEVFGQVHPQDFRYGTWGWLTIVLLGLTIAAVVRRRSGTRPYLPYFAIGVVGLLSAQGPTFRWAKTDLIDNPVFLIPYYVVPGYDALRVPARWFPVIGLLGLVLFSLRGAEPVMAVMARKRKAVLATAILFAAAFVIFEQSPAPLALGESYRLDERPVYKWLAAQPEGSVIVELPISVDIASRTTQEVEGRRMYLSTFHWMRRVNGGISPVIDPRYGPAAFALDNLGVSPEGSALLDRYGVDYVLVVDEDFIAYGRRDADIVRARLDSLPGLKRLRDFPGATVYATR